MDIRYNYNKKLKNIIKFNYIFLILIITIGFIQIILLLEKNQLKKREEKELNEYSDKIENCIDIGNKNKRTIYENIKLSEYCIDKFGTIK